jgi:hypothetical protein
MGLPIPLMTAACNAIGDWIYETPATIKQRYGQNK